MKIWIITIVLLILMVATVCVVWQAIFPQKTHGGRYERETGRYDCFMLGQNIFFSDGFPDPRLNPGPMPMPPKADYEESVTLFGRTFTVGVYGKDPTYARIAAQEAIRRMERIAEIADPANPESEISKINRDACERPLPLSEEMYSLLTRTLEVSDKSKGAYDPTAGPLRDLWRKYSESGEMPPADELGAARALVGRRYVEIDDGSRLIRIKKKGVTLDLRDVIAGFAADQAAWVLKSESVTSGYVRCGDLWRLLAHPFAESEQTWAMGVPDARPDRVSRAARTFSCDRGAVVSKGYYTGYRVIGATAVGDTINPLTGNPCGDVAVCTVIGPNALECDAMASALVVLGGGQIDRLLKEFNPAGSGPKPKRVVPEGETP